MPAKLALIDQAETRNATCRTRGLMESPPRTDVERAYARVARAITMRWTSLVPS